MSCCRPDLTRALEFSDLSQREIASRAGFDRPDMITMMKKGKTRVPIERIPALAKTCGVDPVPYRHADPWRAPSSMK